MLAQMGALDRGGHDPKIDGEVVDGLAGFNDGRGCAWLRERSCRQSDRCQADGDMAGAGADLDHVAVSLAFPGVGQTNFSRVTRCTGAPVFSNALMLAIVVSAIDLSASRVKKA